MEKVKTIKIASSKSSYLKKLSPFQKVLTSSGRKNKNTTTLKNYAKIMYNQK